MLCPWRCIGVALLSGQTQYIYIRRRVNKLACCGDLTHPEVTISIEAADSQTIDFTVGIRIK